MQQDKWDQIKGKVLDQFEIVEEKTEPIELKIDIDETQSIGTKEIIVFISPIGKVKFEYIVKPVILDKKEHYSKRSGTTSRTEYEFSDTEFSRRLEAFKWNSDTNTWDIIDANAFS